MRQRPQSSMARLVLAYDQAETATGEPLVHGQNRVATELWKRVTIKPRSQHMACPPSHVRYPAPLVPSSVWAKAVKRSSLSWP